MQRLTGKLNTDWFVLPKTQNDPAVDTLHHEQYKMQSWETNLYV